MRSGTRTVTFATPPPGATQRLHLATTIGDAAHAIRLTSHKAPGPDKVKCLDFNVQAVWIRDVPNGPKRLIAVGSHWSDLKKNGWSRYVDSAGKLHKLTPAQQRMTLQHWIDTHGGTLEALHKLRRPNGDRPMAWSEAVRYAKSLGVVLCPELKSVAFARADLAKWFVDVCRKYDYPCWSMALLTMKEAAGKCAAIERAGGHFCLIFGRFRSQARGTNKIRNWKVKPSQIWGPGSAKRWLLMR